MSFTRTLTFYFALLQTMSFLISWQDKILEYILLISWVQKSHRMPGITHIHINSRLNERISKCGAEQRLFLRSPDKLSVNWKTTQQKPQIVSMLNRLSCAWTLNLYWFKTLVCTLSPSDNTFKPALDSPWVILKNSAASLSGTRSTNLLCPIIRPSPEYT